MASDNGDCTKTGFRISLVIDFGVAMVLILELLAAVRGIGVDPSLELPLGTGAVLAAAAAGVGVNLLHHGLADSGVLMPMRVTLTTIGVAIAAGGLALLGVMLGRL